MLVIERLDNFRCISFLVWKPLPESLNMIFLRSLQFPKLDQIFVAHDQVDLRPKHDLTNLLNLRMADVDLLESLVLV